MIVVSNTSPISNLLQIGEINLLRQFFLQNNYSNRNLRGNLSNQKPPKNFGKARLD